MLVLKKFKWFREMFNRKFDEKSGRGLAKEIRFFIGLQTFKSRHQELFEIKLAKTQPF
jgi:hypothetical protein